ncbi:hypothetical protein TOPH_09154 [Tolypocladium ophioglossoides CBS 100239]|uniref:Uncharacterized protein n=1 Tax=Tolypocladium ophioglossoides (strain CBS 100239) TaxID=1163406 RepID=A0A0L0MWB5_TOLOC|nr:hypothetical protein TOPH_09154 [Tolypocladium ophioglossoides CBS 100239]
MARTLGRNPIPKKRDADNTAIDRTSGVDIETEDKHGRTALSWAAEMGQSAVIELLLASGANTEVRGSSY